MRLAADPSAVSDEFRTVTFDASITTLSFVSCTQYMSLLERRAIAKLG